MKLIVITSPEFFVEEDKIITILFEEGLDILHLRKPDTSAVYSERLLTLLPQKYLKRIVTHEHFHLKKDFGLMGIHLNQRNASEPKDYSGHISCSCRTLEDLALKKKFYDYIFLRPMFDMKSGILTEYSAEEIRQSARQKVIDKDVMAFGGITPDNIMQIKDYGFGGAVVMDNLWDKFDFRNDVDFTKIIAHFRLLKKMAD